MTNEKDATRIVHVISRNWFPKIVKDMSKFRFMLCGVEVRSEQVLSLLQKMASDSAVLTLVGSSFHH